MIERLASQFALFLCGYENTLTPMFPSNKASRTNKIQSMFERYCSEIEFMCVLQIAMIEYVIRWYVPKEGIPKLQGRILYRIVRSSFRSWQ